MAPAKPPLPTPRYFSFQPATGIQTSKRISESLVGRITPATRQNSGRPSIGFPYGGVYVPAETDAAVVMVVSGSLAEERPAQSAASAGRVRRSAGMTLMVIVRMTTSDPITHARIVIGR